MHFIFIGGRVLFQLVDRNDGGNGTATVSGVEAGDLLVALAFAEDTGAPASAPSTSTPAGWTLLESASDGTFSQQARCELLYKISTDGSEDGVSQGTFVNQELDRVIIWCLRPLGFSVGSIGSSDLSFVHEPSGVNPAAATVDPSSSTADFVLALNSIWSSNSSNMDMTADGSFAVTPDPSSVTYLDVENDTTSSSIHWYGLKIYQPSYESVPTLSADIGNIFSDWASPTSAYIEVNKA